MNLDENVLTAVALWTICIWDHVVSIEATQGNYQN